MVLVTYVRGFQNFRNHKKIARYTFPIWMYIAVTGVIVYLMISLTMFKINISFVQH